MTRCSAILLAPLVLFLASCVTSVPTAGRGGTYLSGLDVSERAIRNPAEAASFWDGDSISGAPLIRINRSEQMAYFYKVGQLVGISPVSSGRSSHPTPAGSFKVVEKNADHESSLYGHIEDLATGETVVEDADVREHQAGEGQVFVHAPMPFFLRFNGAVGMHAGHLPGYPASHGCVRLPRHMARKFFEHAAPGTPVIVE